MSEGFFSRSVSPSVHRSKICNVGEKHGGAGFRERIMSTMITFVSRQVWPQIVAVEHFKPERLILLHSSDERESLNPAKRLEKFFSRLYAGLKGNIEILEIPHDSLEGMGRVLEGLESEGALLNLTGGNKLMTIAGYEWAREHGCEAFYIERGNLLVDLMHNSVGKIPAGILNGFSALDLIRCQLDGFKIKDSAEELTLDSGGGVIRVGRPGVDREKEGDALELQTAETLLRLGVPRVHRSVGMKGPDAPGLSNRLAVMEIDLLFNWDGRIWIVDCKDKGNTTLDWFDCVTASSKMHKDYESLRKRLFEELAKTEAKAFKDDLVAASFGGILGKIISVRRVRPEPEIEHFARSNGIEIVLKKDLEGGLEPLIHPGSAPTADALEGLKVKFSS